jgi:polysaccharide pyruvyl transferase WcaK-like protein
MRIGVFGVAGFNRGDDAIAEAMVNGLTARFPQAEILVAMIGNVALMSRDRVRGVFVNRRSPLGLANLIATIASVDVVILGGGSLLQDKLGGSRIKGVLGYAWMVTLAARTLGKPVFTAPLGIDVLSTPAGQQAGREVLSRIDFLCVRDQLSAQNAKSLGRACDWISPDPAFALEQPVSEAPDERYYCFAPAFEGPLNDVASRIYEEIARELLSGPEAVDIRLIAMDERPHEDGGNCRTFLDGLGEDVRAHFELVIPRTAADAQAILTRSRGVVAMRLHAIILAYGRVPVFCLSRTTKTEALMADYDVSGMRVDAKSDVKLIAKAAAESISQYRELNGQLNKLRNLGSDLSSYFDELARHVAREAAAS